MCCAFVCGFPRLPQIAQCIVAATYQRIAKAGNAIATLTEQEGLAAIYRAAYTRCAPPARRRALLSAGEEGGGAAVGRFGVKDYDNCLVGMHTSKDSLLKAVPQVGTGQQWQCCW